MRRYACIHCGSRDHYTRECPLVRRSSPGELDTRINGLLDERDKRRDDTVKAIRKAAKR